MVNNINHISRQNNQDTLINKIEKARNNTERKIERRAINVRYDCKNDKIIIQFVDGSEFRFNSKLGQGLQNATPEQLAEVEITPSGKGLHWETLDADLSIPDLLQNVYGNQKWMSELKQKKLI